MIEISVIVPMYNAELYIRQCIDSVLAQENVSLELIIVDDESKDKSKEIVKTYGNKIILLEQKNGGASSARNNGLRHATGDYIMFLDSDDWLNDTTICRKCINQIKKHNLEMCIFNYQYYNNRTGTFTKVTPIPDELTQYFNIRDVAHNMVAHGLYPASPCFRVIKREFLISNSIFFIENSTAEDIEWFTHILTKIHSLSFIQDVAYIYRKGVATSVTGNSSPQKIENLLNRISDSIDLTKRLNDEYLIDAILSGLAYEYCILMGNMGSRKCNKDLEVKAKHLSCVMRHNIFPKIKYIYVIYKLIGFKLTSYFLNYFIKRYARSNKNK